MKKYTVRPPKDLRSKFLRKQEARAKKEKELEEEKLRKEEEDRQAVSKDGLGVHQPWSKKACTVCQNSLDIALRLLMSFH